MKAEESKFSESASLTSIAEQLNLLNRKIDEQSLLKKDILNFREACLHIDVSESHMYKLTSRKKIPHYCPQGGRLRFKRSELDEWLLRNRIGTQDEIEQQAADYLIQKGKVKV